MAVLAARSIRAAIDDLMPRSAATVVVVAIDGHSGVGKSAIASALARYPDTCIVSGDDFYRVMEMADRLALSAAEGADQYIDWQRLRTEALVPLREGRTASFRPYDWTGDCLAADDVTVPPAPVVIVEGVYSARPQLADLISLPVLVEAPADVRRARITARGDEPDYWDSRWAAAEGVYLSTIRPRETFDLIVSN